MEDIDNAKIKANNTIHKKEEEYIVDILKKDLINGKTKEEIILFLKRFMTAEQNGYRTYPVINEFLLKLVEKNNYL